MDLILIASIYTILAVYIAWFVFFIERANKLAQRKEEKKDILKSIEKELILLETWLGTSYDDNNYSILQEPWHPFHMVYGLGNNISIKNAISFKSVSLLSENLLESLVVLNQKLGSFEQHINRLIEFNSSQPVLATQALYYYDHAWRNYNQQKKWLEFEKLAKNLSTGKKLTDIEIHLIGSVRLLKDLHVIGIGSVSNPVSLRASFVETKNLIQGEQQNLEIETQFKQDSRIDFLDKIIFSSIFVLPSFYFILKGGELMLVLGIIFLVSLLLGFIKYGSIVADNILNSWQHKFVELWNCFINFFIPGLIGYYFILVRWPLISKGDNLDIWDFVLFIVFILGLFGHLSVMSINITKGVEAILSRVLERG